MNDKPPLELSMLQMMAGCFGCKKKATCKLLLVDASTISAVVSNGKCPSKESIR